MPESLRKTKIKLLLLVQDVAALGGAEILLTNLVEEFTKKGVKVTTVSNFKPFLKMQKKAGAQITFVRSRINVFGGIKGLIKFFFQLPWALIWYSIVLKKHKKSGGNLILISGFSDKIVVSPLAYLFDIPVIWLEHSSLTPVFRRNFGVPKILYKVTLKYPRLIIVPSNYTKDKLLEELRVKRSKLKVIKNGIKIITDLEINIIKKQRTLVKKYTVPRDAFIIGMMSRLEYAKGQDVLIEAASILKERSINIFTVIAGEGPDSERLKQIVTERGLENRVLFLGFVPEKEKYKIIGSFDVYVFPTRWELEGFGIAAVEAMMIGLPVVASNLGPMPEVVGNAGLLVEPTKEKVAEAIVKLIKSQKLKDELSIRGRKRSKLFDIGKTANLYLAVFKNVS